MTARRELDPPVLDVLDLGQLKAEFAALPEPDTGSLVGRWDGTLVGSPAVVRHSRRLGSLTPLRGWCGKQFVDPHHVVNLVRADGVVREGLSGDVVLGSSRLDGRPAAVVVYRHTAPGPWKGLRGELRVLPGGDLLGMLLLQLGPVRLGPFPYRLHRSG